MRYIARMGQPSQIKPGSENPRVVDTYSVLTKLRMLRSVRARIRDVANKKGVGTDQFPATLQIQTHTDCTSRCTICPHEKTSQMFPSVKMDRALFDKIADECAEEPGLRAFSLVLQNEPLMDPDLFDKIRYFQSRNQHDVIVFIVTNGMLLNEENADKLIESGIDMMHISVNGWGKEDFEYINRGKNFDVFMRNLESFLARDLAKVGVNLSFVMNAKYKDEMERAIAHWKQRGYRVHVHGISNRAGMVDESVLEELKYPPEAERWRTRMLKKLAAAALPCCPYPFFQGSILADGQVLVCTHDWGRKTVVGNVRDQTLREVWNGEAINEVRMKLIEGRAEQIDACTDCTVFAEQGFA